LTFWFRGLRWWSLGKSCIEARRAENGWVLGEGATALTQPARGLPEWGLGCSPAEIEFGAF